MFIIVVSYLAYAFPLKFCVKARVMKIMWACRVRCCKSCFKDKCAPSVKPLLHSLIVGIVLSR